MKRIILAGLMALIITVPSRADDEELIAHEWGTFTSIQGSDGELLYWNAVDTIDLPNFVYNWTRPGLERLPANPFGAFTKQSYTALQRMETPVIYFYSERQRRIDVTVEFPQGYITEWFPQAQTVGPSRRKPSSLLQHLDQWTSQSGIKTGFSFTSQFGEKPVTNSVIRWEDVRVESRSQAGSRQQRFPDDGTDNHYFNARDTDANPLRLTSRDARSHALEVEKFLFYRGVGQFQTPLKVLMQGEDITVINAGPLPLKHLFAITVQDGRVVFNRLERLAPGITNVFRRDFARQNIDLATANEQISNELTHALTGEGLFPREAAAMVATWQKAWFAESGTRVLYVLPRQWTDQILPINIEPAPQELVRVMVGRAELITPTVEEKLCECIGLFRQQDEASHEQALKLFQAIGLGRFAPSAIDLVVRRSTDPQFSESARRLLQAVRTSMDSAAPNITAQSSSGRPASNGG